MNPEFQNITFPLVAHILATAFGSILTSPFGSCCCTREEDHEGLTLCCVRTLRARREALCEAQLLRSSVHLVCELGVQVEVRVCAVSRSDDETHGEIKVTISNPSHAPVRCKQCTQQSCPQHYRAAGIDPCTKALHEPNLTIKEEELASNGVAQISCTAPVRR